MEARSGSPKRLQRCLVAGIANQYCSPSFETAASRPPQDEVQLVETQRPHAEERATRASRSMGSRRLTDFSWSVLALRTHQPLRALRTQDMMVQVCDPLPAGSRHVQVFYPVLDVHRDAVPEKCRVLFNDVGGRRIAKLPVGADLLELPIQRVCFPRIQGIAELPDEIGGLDQFRLETGCLLAVFRDRKACHLERRRDTRGVDDWRFLESLEYKYFRPVDVIRRERRIRCAAREHDLRPLGVNDEFSFGIAAQGAAHIANVMQQAGHDQVAIVRGLYSFMHHHSVENVASDHGDLQRVFVIVVKRVAPGQTFDGAPRRRAYTLRHIVACRAENPAKIPGEEIAKLVCRDGRYGFHWRSPNDRGSFRSPCSLGVRPAHPGRPAQVFLSASDLFLMLRNT